MFFDAGWQGGSGRRQINLLTPHIVQLLRHSVTIWSFGATNRSMGLASHWVMGEAVISIEYTNELSKSVASG